MSNTVQTSAAVAFLNGIPRPKSPIEGAAVDPGARLVPALIRMTDPHHPQVVYIECPRWCVEDHMEEQQSVEDITHWGDPGMVEVLTFLTGTGQAARIDYVLNARLEADPSSADPRRRASHVIVWEDSSALAAQLTADMADELADDLVGFAAHLRHLARTVRVANHEAPAERAA